MLAPSAPSHTTTFQSACSPIFCSRGGAVIREKSLNAARRRRSRPRRRRSPDGERQLLPGRVGIVALAHAQLAALARRAHALDPAQCLDARGVERDRDRGGDEQRDVRLLRALGVEDGDRVAGEGFAIEVEGGLAALAVGLQEDGVGGVSGPLGDRERHARLLDDRLRIERHGRRHDPVGEGHDDAQGLLPEHPVREEPVHGVGAAGVGDRKRAWDVARDEAPGSLPRAEGERPGVRRLALGRVQWKAKP